MFSVENDLSLFEFHDATLSFVSFDGTDLTVAASGVSIHKGTAQNPSDFDMELASARIVFRDFRVAAFEAGAICSGQDALERILAELKNGLTVYHFEKEAEGYSIGGSGMEPYFVMTFDFDALQISWDGYKKKAWYELHRRYRYEVVLETPSGDERAALTVHWHGEEVYRNGVLEQGPSVGVECAYGGEKYWGHGKDPLWIDAFAALQRQLPQGVRLKCCLTCRYGNQCPVGDVCNEVFCTRDVTITQKSDLHLYTEDPVQREQRGRQYCDVCRHYAPQSEEFYTYNDYLHFLWI